MIRLLLALFLLLGICKAQVNLIVSPDFESPGSTSPDGNWATVPPGSTDYLTPVMAPPPGSPFGSPLNAFGYQVARSGGAYMGIITQYNNLVDSNLLYSEHFRTFLNDTLKANTCYLAGLYFVNANYSKKFANRLGIFFSKTLPAKTSFTYSTEFAEFHQPQVELDSNQFFTDTLNWMLLSGVFKAKGDEIWVVYGNFYNKARTKYIPKAPLTTSINVPVNYGDTLWSYVMIDDAFLYEIPNALAKPDTALCIGQNVSIGLNNDTTTAQYNWLPQTGLDCPNCPNPIASPSISTTYTLTKTVKGCSTQSKITVTVNPKPQPVLNVSKIKMCISNNTVLLTGEPPGGIYLGANISDSLCVPSLPGTYTLGYYYTDSKNCSNNSSVKSITVHPLPQKPVIDEKDSVLCVSSANTTLTAVPANGVFVGENLIGDVFRSKVPGTNIIYYTVTDANTCSNSDTLIISVKDCANGKFMIPNVFSPNADGANDVWKVVLPYGVLFIKIEIYNRWGSIVYERDGGAWPNLSNLIWDGFTIAGVGCDPGTYFYVLQTQAENQPIEVKKGTITLAR